MRFSSLLLSSAALLASGTVGFAADLPSKKAAPVEFVRVCSQFGAGFFYVPGSDTCLKVSGRVRADYAYNERFRRQDNFIAFRARGYVALDSFTATDWGPVRATTRVFVTRDSGRGGVGGVSIGNGGATTDANVNLDWAYIQFAGITAGRLATSTFEFAPLGGVSYTGGGALGRGSDYGSINALAYTASFGGGFSATLALEDGTERRSGGNSDNGIRLATAGYLADGKFVDAVGKYAGQAMPDVVARLDLAGSWGSAMLAGAVHQTRSGDLFVNGGVASYGDTEYGFAVQGGVKVNLPMLAAGDALYLQAAYASGANSYTGWAGTTTAGFGYDLVAPDVVYDSIGGSHLTKSFSVTGGLLHYWTPALRQGLFAAYGKLDAYGSKRDAAAVTVGSTLIWSPVKGLDIGGELGYTVLTDKPNFYTLAGNRVAGSSDSNWFGRLRIQRDF